MTDTHIPLPTHRNIVLRQLRARPRLFMSIALGIASFFSIPYTLAPHLPSRLLLGWNAGICLYLLLAFVMIARSTSARMHWRARIQDEGRIVVLVGVVLSSLACLAAIVAELSVVKDIHGVLKTEHICLAVLTVVSSWCFVHLMFALHYAHDYYGDLGRGGDGGLQFPGNTKPDYYDFLYLACIIGTSGQTADVSFSSQKTRRIGLAHCVLSYAFNTTILALMINIASGLF